jgi:hypothetical protein
MGGVKGRVAGAGVELALESFNEGNSRLAFVIDPDGIWIELECPRRPRQAIYLRRFLIFLPIL